MKIKTGSYALDFLLIAIVMDLLVSIVLGILTKSFCFGFNFFAVTYLFLFAIIMPLQLVRGDKYKKGNE